MGATLKAPLYVLPHGIEVIGEYAPRGKNRYWRVRIRPHPFFPGARIIANGFCVRRSRVLLAAKLGRALTSQEHAHHRDEDRNNEHPDNIEQLTPAEHNRHHKIGTRHTKAGKEHIAAGLKRAYVEGRRGRPTITSRDRRGRITKCLPSS